MKTFNKIIFSMLFLILFMNLSSAFSGSGTGTLADPYVITNWTTLNETRNALTANYSLAANLSLATSDYAGIGTGWLPIGNSTIGFQFKGSFNGNNNDISDLVVSMAGVSNVGLFGGAAGSISNLGLINASVTGAANTGALVGYLYVPGLVNNSHTAGTVVGTSTIGGLVGYQYGAGFVLNSNSTATVNGTGASGGLVGGQFSTGTINNSYASGSIASTGGNVGGLVGTATGSINNCYATGRTNGSSESGGLVGYQSAGTISNSYATGNVFGANYFGGFVGRQDGGAISNSYATGNVTGSYDYAGGLVGRQSGGTISNSYSSGKVGPARNSIGGLIGGQTAGSASASYWDNQTSGQSSSAGGAGVVGKTTADMKLQATFTGWDFSSIWGIVSYYSSGYPYLRIFGNPPFADDGTAAQNVNACNTMNTTNATYTLTTNVTSTGTCFNVTANNITINCNGYWINYSTAGTLGYGVYSNKNYTTVRNCIINEGNSTTNSKYPIYFNGTYFGLISTNTIYTINSQSFLSLLNNRNTTVLNNILRPNPARGLDVIGSQYTNVSGNSVNWGLSVNAGGFYFTNSPYSYIFNNTHRESGNSVSSVYLENSSSSTIANNTFSVGSNVNIISVSNTNYTNITNNNLTNTGLANSPAAYNIQIYTGSFNNITNNIFTGSYSGSIYIVRNSLNNTVFNNTIYSVNGNGVKLAQGANYNNISSNNITSIAGGGIYLLYTSDWGDASSAYNTFSNNNITSTQTGIYLSTSYPNTFINNMVNVSAANFYGLYSDGNSNGNSFANTFITTGGTSGYGIYLYNANQNFTMTDSFVSTTSANVPEFYIRNAVTGGVWNLTNVTHPDGITPLNISWSTGANGTLNNFWYANATVNYTNGSIAPGISIAAYNVNGNLYSSNTTDATGSSKLTLLEYKRNGTTGATITNYNNYTINATTSYYPETVSVNMSGNKNVFFTVDVNSPVGILTSPQNNSNIGNGSTSINFTANISDVGEGVSSATLNIFGTQNKWLDFDGSDYVQIADSNSLDVGNVLTISAWVKVTNLSTRNNIYSSSNNNTANASWLEVGTSGTSYINGVAASINGWYIAATADAAAPMTQNDAWYHVVYTRNGSGANTHAIYVNGVSQPLKVSAALGFLDNSAPKLIGGRTNSTQLFNGSMDEVRIYNRSLSQAEVTALYNNGFVNNISAVSTTGLVSYYDFQNSDKNITRLVDVGTNINNGTIRGAIWADVYNTTRTYSPGVLTSTVGVVVTLVDGIYNWFWSIFDSAGNGIQTAVNTLAVDTVFPDYTFTSPVNGSYYNSTNVLFNVSTTSSPNASIIPNIDNSLVSWWSMDNVFGTTVLDQMGRNNGSASLGVSQITNGKFGKAMDFNGSSRINTSISLPVDANLSVFGWLNPLNISSTGDQYFFGLNAGTYGWDPQFYRPSGSNQFYFLIYSSGHKCIDGTLQTTAFATNTWVNLGYTRQANYSGTYSNYTIYKNGVIVGSRLCNGTVSSSSFKIGVRGIYETTNNWNGSIDDVMIFNRSLSADEILSLYNATAYNHYENLSGQGNHTFNSYVQDFAGNVNTTGLVTFTADTASPSGTLINPANNTFSNSSSNNFTANISDNIGIVNATLNVYNSTGLVNQTTVNYTQGTLTQTVGIVVSLIDGLYSWFYSIFDFAGNAYATGNNTLTIDTIFPGYTFTSPVNGNYYNSTNISFAVSTTLTPNASIISNIDNSLVSWYRMDDTNSTGTLVQDYMNRNNGTAYESIQISNGKFGKSWSFDGVDDNVTILNSPSLNPGLGSFSYGAWVYANSNVGSWDMALSKGGTDASTVGYELELGAGAWEAYVSNGTMKTNQILLGSSVLSQWVHLFVVIDRDSGRVFGYRNGARVSNITGILGNISSSRSLSFGRQSASSPAYKFNGSIDDVMIFNRSLSADEILSLYNATAYNHYENLSGQGNHTFNSYIQDFAGNVNTTGEATFIVDTLNSNATLISANNTFANNGTQNLTANLSDNLGIKNATLNVVDTQNKWLNFDGADDKVIISNVQGEASISVSAWVRHVGSSSWGSIVDSWYGGNFYLFTSGSSIIQWMSGPGDVTADYGYSSLNQWHHIVGTMNRTSGRMDIYLDGGAVHENKTVSIGSWNSNAGMTLGAVAGGATYWFNGSMDEIRIYNRSLSASEISALYNNKLAANATFGNTSGLVAYYDMQNSDGNITRLVDMSGNGNNGTIVGANFTSTYSSTTNYAAGVLTSTVGIVVSLVDGIYNWFYNIFDFAGNQVTTANNTLTVDTVFPSFIFTSPTNGAYYNTTNISFAVSTTSSPNTSIIPNIDNSLVSWYRMDDTNSTGTLVQDYMNRNNGTAFGGATQVTNGKLGKAWSFDGSNDLITIQNSPSLNFGTGDFSISVWIKKVGADSSTHRIIAKRTGSAGWFNLYSDATNVIKLELNGTFTLSATTSNLTDGSWHHIVAVRGSGTNGVVIYENAVSKGVGTSAVDVNNINAVEIGGRADLAQLFNGSIDDVMIFNRSLSADEILSLYNATAYNHYENFSTQGNHTFNSYVQDFAGNVNTTGAITFTTDTVSPSGTLINPANNTFSNSSSNNLTANISDNIGIVNATLNVYNSTGLVNQTTVNYTQGTLTSTVGIVVSLVDGIYKWFYNIFDFAGNVYNTANNTLTVDTIFPSYTFTSPVNGNYYNSTNISFVVSTTSTPNASIIPNIDNSLVSWWRMDDTNSSGTLVQDYMNRNNGTATNGAAQVTNGKFGKAFGFDGTNDHINFGDTLNNSNFTISSWINCIEVNDAGNNYIITKFSQGATGSYVLRILPGGTLQLLYNVGGTNYFLNSDSVLQNNTWYYVTATFKSGLQAIYLNGALLNSTSTTGSITITSDPINIGSRTSSSNYNFNGSIDDVMIFNRSLSADEILSLYNATAYNHYENLSGQGNHTFNSYIQDFAGNVNTTGAVTFTIDTSQPSATLLTPSNNTFTNQTTGINLTANLTDNIGIKNATLNVVDTQNKWLNFDGVDDTVNLGLLGDFDQNANFSISLWAYDKGSSAWAHVIGKSGDSYWAVRQADTLSWYGFLVNNSEIDYSGAVFNRWYHLAAIVNGANSSFYVDGNLVGSQSGAFNFNSQNVYIGSRANALRYFNGSIDEVRIYNRTLSQSEITALYNNKLTADVDIFDTTSLVSYYDFQNSDGNATRLVDMSGNGNNGTITGATFTSTYSSVLTIVSGSVQQTVGTIVNLVEGIYNWFINIFDLSGNQFNSQNNTLTIDTIYPLIEFDSSSPANASGLSEAFNITILINETNIANVTLYFNSTNYYFDSINNASYFTLVSGNQYNFSVEKGPLGSAESIYYNLTITDKSGQQNTTETRLVTGNAPPSLVSLAQTPSVNSSLDPITIVEVNVTLRDDQANFDSAWIQWKNSTQNWSEIIGTSQMIAMTNVSINSTYHYVNASFTLPIYEDDIQYRIFANDTVGAEANLSIYNISNRWDCTWNVSINNLDSKGGFFEEKELGNVTISNTGDVNYTTNNCSIVFAKTTSGNGWQANANFSGTYFSKEFSGDGAGGLKYYYEGDRVTSLIVNASQNKTLQVRAMFPRSSEVFTEYLYFVIASSINDTQTGTNNVTISASMIVTPGAYLENQVETPSSNPYLVSLTPGNYSFVAYVKDVVATADNENNTAYNVSFNWTLPSAIESLFVHDSLSAVYENLTNTSKQYLNLTMVLDSSNLASLSQQIYEIKTYVFGYENSTGNLTLINHTSGTLLQDSVNITFQCHGASDGICVAACGYLLDLDCSAPSTASSSAGGGGGGGGGGDVFAKSEAVFELIRGGDQEFILTLENKLSFLKQNINITVSGANSEYVSFTPRVIDSLGPNSKTNIVVRITAPSYFSADKNLLKFDFNGEIVANTTTKFTEQKFVTLRILDVPRAEVEMMMNTSIDIISKMNYSGLIITGVEELFSLMQADYVNYSFSDLKEQYKQIDLIYKSALEANKSIEEVMFNIADAENRGLVVSETKKLLYLAEIMYKRGDYILAAEKLKEAKLTFALETKGEFKLLYAIKNNPGESAAILVSSLLIFVGAGYATRLRLLKRKLRVLAEEEQLLLQLMKVIQRDCFENNRMPMEEYNEAMFQYESRLGEVIQEKIKTETIISNLMKIKGAKNALIQEKERLQSLIRAAQEDYLNKGKLETRVYENMLRTYSSRLSQIEEEMVFGEAQEAMRKVTGWHLFGKR